MPNKFYLLGIGGISMSTLAVFLKVYGHNVSGSDLVESENLKGIITFDIDYYIGHHSENIKKFNPDYVVINFAINEQNEELNWAKKNKKKIITRAELLGKISKKFKNTIAISGTHGKTTTTALISEIFIEAGLKPTVHIGGIMKYNNSNFLIGNKKYFITEACEYKNSFLSLNPSLGIVLNIEGDHLDFFKNVEEISQSFQKFLNNSKSKLYSTNSDCFVIETNKDKVFYQAKNIKKNNTGYLFDLMENNKLISTFQTNFFGEHNIKNSVVAIATSLFYGIKLKTIKKVIRNYHGVKRRFEKIGKINKTIIIHDYAHHPTEIVSTINQAKDYGRVLTIFQPHTFSRTKSLYEFFIKSFNESDGLILVKTYPAREKKITGGSAFDLFQSIQSNKFDYLNYAKDFITAKKQVFNIVSNYDCVLILGAGDIENLAYKIFK
ncbi:MAG: UDP-N-acetylmuramate--L-alanine ligase [Clostridia bacterium]|nr:UDP-N-acetylmuramate--L-alanine ligase [Clostridia bacterium]